MKKLSAQLKILFMVLPFYLREVTLLLFRSFKRWVRTFLLAMIVPVLIGLFLILSWSIYWRTADQFNRAYQEGLLKIYNSPAAGVPDDKTNFIASVHALLNPVFQEGNGINRKLSIDVNGIDISLFNDKYLTKDFCIESIYYLIGGEDFIATLQGQENWSTFFKSPENGFPVCIALVEANQTPGIPTMQPLESDIRNFGRNFTFDLRPGLATKLNYVHENEYNPFYYPFITTNFTYTFYIKYSIRSNGNILEKGMLSPYISSVIPIKQELINWEITSTFEKKNAWRFLENNSEMDIEAINLIIDKQGPNIIHSLTFQKPLYMRLLTAIVPSMIFITIMITFFLKKSETFIPSVLGILFGIMGVKALLPTLSNTTTFIDVILLLCYFLLGISIVNFVINQIRSPVRRT